MSAGSQISLRTPIHARGKNASFSIIFAISGNRLLSLSRVKKQINDLLSRAFHVMMPSQIILGTVAAPQNLEGSES